MIHRWNHSWKETIPYLEKAIIAGKKSGDLHFLSLSYFTLFRQQEENLELSCQEAEKVFSLLNSLGSDLNLSSAKLILQMRLALRCLTKTPLSLSDSVFDEEVWFKQVETQDRILVTYYLQKLRLYVILGAFQEGIFYI